MKSLCLQRNSDPSTTRIAGRSDAGCLAYDASDRMNVTRYETADAFLQAAQPLLMLAEAENNLLLGVAQGIARNPTAAKNPYLATVAGHAGIVACAVYIAPFKLVIT